MTSDSSEQCNNGVSGGHDAAIAIVRVKLCGEGMTLSFATWRRWALPVSSVVDCTETNTVWLKLFAS